MQNMQNLLANMPTWEERFEFASAARVISNTALNIKEWEVKVPHGKHLVVTMQTPDGRIMLVETVKPEGFYTFSAHGYIDAMPCMMVGHISTLRLFCAYEETKGKAKVGFIAEVLPEPKPIIESQPIPE